MSRLPLTFASAPYDRTLPLFDGRVLVEGIDLNVVLLRYEDTFWRMLRHQEFDVSEMSLSSYLISKEKGPNFIALPVFLSRVFRHSSIYINRNAQIGQASDLKGKRVGVPEYQITAAVWIRGILEHEYSVPPAEMTWLSGGLDEPGRIEKLDLNIPADVSLTLIPKNQTLNSLLVNGELDAIVTARAPSSYNEKHPNVARLFEDYKAEEISYYKRTGIYPPMHCVAIRREVYERNRWIAQSLYKAFLAAKEYSSIAHMFDGHLRYALPFLHAAVDEHHQIFGDDDPWKYGVEENRHTLETLVSYSHEQGLIPRAYDLSELFAEEIWATSRN
ncbi:ABC transporter substrate-binding protein [Alphaproteobacteria bacterium]|nr:ABC transporter substrate-binding protein [Alphaproteobacteria bacterium]